MRIPSDGLGEAINDRLRRAAGELLDRYPNLAAAFRPVGDGEIVAVLGIISLFTHMHIFWVAGLLLAMIDLPDFGTPLRSIAGSVERIADAAPGESREPELPGLPPVEKPISTASRRSSVSSASSMASCPAMRRSATSNPALSSSGTISWRRSAAAMTRAGCPPASPSPR